CDTLLHGAALVQSPVGAPVTSTYAMSPSAAHVPASLQTPLAHSACAAHARHEPLSQTGAAAVQSASSRQATHAPDTQNVPVCPQPGHSMSLAHASAHELATQYGAVASHSPAESHGCAMHWLPRHNSPSSQVLPSGSPLL